MMFAKLLHVVLRPLLVLTVVVAPAATAYAQTAVTPPRPSTAAQERIVLSIGGGIQTRTPGFSESRNAPLYAEQATFENRYGAKDGTAFGGGAAALIWRDVWAGVAFSSTSHRHGAMVSGRVPHPFRFNAARAFDGIREGLSRKETAVHLQVMYRVRITPRLRVGVFAGPSWISAKQDLIDQTRYNEEYPYDSASFAGTTVVNASRKATAFGVGANVTVDLLGPLSAGLEIRRAAAEVDFETASGRRVRSTIGGTQALAGVSVGF